MSKLYLIDDVVHIVKDLLKYNKKMLLCSGDYFDPKYLMPWERHASEYRQGHFVITTIPGSLPSQAQRSTQCGFSRYDSNSPLRCKPGWGYDVTGFSQVKKKQEYDCSDIVIVVWRHASNLCSCKMPYFSQIYRVYLVVCPERPFFLQIILFPN